MLDTAPVAPARPRSLVDRLLLGPVGRFFGADPCAAPRRTRAANDDDGVIESAAALDGFSGPSHWLGWAGFGMDHVEPIDWRQSPGQEAGREAATTKRGDTRRSGFGD
jgi:hypothetical protein